MGSHGRSGWGQLLLGSVTTKVVYLAAIFPYWFTESSIHPNKNVRRKSSRPATVLRPLRVALPVRIHSPYVIPTQSTAFQIGNFDDSAIQIVQSVAIPLARQRRLLLKVRA